MSQLQVTGEAKIRDIQGPVVANDGVITALDGLPSQYVRGDGTLADIPTVTGGGSSVSYYLNGSVNQGTFGGSTYYQMSRDAITGTGTNFSTSSDGLLAQFITDAGDPDVSSIPSGNWNIEFFMNVSASSGSLASFYVEFYKYDGSTFTLIASNSATPEILTNTTTVDAYYTSVAFAETALATTDRLAIRIYANVASKTVTLYTEDNRLCQIVTTFSKGLLSMNSLTDQEQYLTTGTSGTNFAIVSSGDTHTFNLPVASATNTGKLSSTDWSTFNNKVPYTGATESVDLGENTYIGGFVQANGTSVLSGTISLKQNGFIPAATGYATIGSVSAGKLSIYFGESGLKSVELQNDLLTASRTYDFPDASGTLALTSDLSGYVPYTGATSSVDLGAYTLTGAGIFSNPSGTTSGQINLKIGSSNASYVGYNSITALSNGVFAFISDISSGAALKDARFDFGSLTNNTTRTYTMPDASGTIALTSNLSSYLPLTGGTLTGALSGTSATFSSSVTAGSTTYQKIGLTFPSTYVSKLGFGLNAGDYGSIQYDESGNELRLNSNYPTGLSTFYTNGTERMRITSGGNVGIGVTNPDIFSRGDARMVGIGASGASDNLALALNAGASGGRGAQIYMGQGGTRHFTISSNVSESTLGTTSNTPLRFTTNDTERMRITSGGNVGIGVVPSAWSTITSLQIKNGFIGGSSNNVYLGSNAYYDGSVYRYIASSYANLYYQDSNSNDHIWYNASSGTAGNTISFNERMRITSGGALLVGGTGFAYNSVRQQIWFTGSSTEYGLSIAALNVGNTRFIDFNIGSGSGGQAGSISWNGSIVAYNITSDYRLKQDFKDYNGLDLISKIKTYDFEWKADNSRMFGVVAHELQEVIPYAVNGEKDAKEMQQVDYSKLTPINTKAIQELYELVKEQQGQIEELKELIKNK